MDRWIYPIYMQCEPCSGWWEQASHVPFRSIHCPIRLREEVQAMPRFSPLLHPALDNTQRLSDWNKLRPLVDKGAVRASNVHRPRPKWRRVTLISRRIVALKHQAARVFWRHRRLDSGSSKVFHQPLICTAGVCCHDSQFGSCGCPGAYYLAYFKITNDHLIVPG